MDYTCLNCGTLIDSQPRYFSLGNFIADIVHIRRGLADKFIALGHGIFFGLKHIISSICLSRFEKVFSNGRSLLQQEFFQRCFQILQVRQLICRDALLGNLNISGAYGSLHPA